MNKKIKYNNILKMGNENDKYVKFVSPCPVCKNNDNNYWVHSNKNYPLLLSSPNIRGELLSINNKGNIKCNNSDCYYNKHPMFIMDWEFNCDHHLEKFNNDYLKPGKTRAINAIHMLNNNSDLPSFSREEEDNICQKILDYNN